jgi:hypothetical protein
MNSVKNGNKYNLVFGVIILLVVGLSCDGTTKIEGRIFNEKGKPVQGAQVTLKIDSKTLNAETKSDGSYAFFETHAPFQMTYKLTVSKEGFQTYEQPFESKKELGYKRDIILKKQ